jgi:hypothetical protein
MELKDSGAALCSCATDPLLPGGQRCPFPSSGRLIAKATNGRISQPKGHDVIHSLSNREAGCGANFPGIHISSNAQPLAVIAAALSVRRGEGPEVESHSSAADIARVHRQICLWPTGEIYSHTEIIC